MYPWNFSKSLIHLLGYVSMGYLKKWLGLLGTSLGDGISPPRLLWRLNFSMIENHLKLYQISKNLFLLCYKKVSHQGSLVKRSLWSIKLKRHGVLPWGSKNRWTYVLHTLRTIGIVVWMAHSICLWVHLHPQNLECKGWHSIIFRRMINGCRRKMILTNSTNDQGIDMLVT